MLGRLRILSILTVFFLSLSPTAQSQTIGLIQNDPGAFPGYTLFGQLAWPQTYLIDNNGLLVHTWVHTLPTGNMAYIKTNGNLLRGVDPGPNPVFQAGGDAGMVEELDWDGNLLWQFMYSDSSVRHHHDIAELPNGNVLILAWEFRSNEECIAAGRDPASMATGVLWPEQVVEVEKVGATGGNIVWEWHMWDHLIQDFDSTKENFGVVADHPELIDINFRADNSADWIHANALNYNAELDQIMISANRFGELWIIDHSTTTEEAAGHTGGLRGKGGDLLYRYGNPQAYDRGDSTDQVFYRQHDCQWIKPGLPGAGNIMVFNNGNGRPEGTFSTVEEFAAPHVNGDYTDPPPGEPYGPGAPVWKYTGTPPGDFYSSFISGAERQPNGNTLICEGATGTVFEVDAATDTTMWMYINPVNSGGPQYQGQPISGNTTFRANRYAIDYAGFTGRDLSSGDPIELDPTGVTTFVSVPRFTLEQNYPNPFRPATTIAFSLMDRAPVSLSIFDVAGRRVANLVDAPLAAGDHRYAWNADRLPSGVYHYVLKVGDEVESKKMVLVR